MAWNHPTQKIESESKAAKSSRVWWGLGAGLIVAAAAVAGVVSLTAGAGRLYGVSGSFTSLCKRMVYTF